MSAPTDRRAVPPRRTVLRGLGTLAAAVATGSGVAGCTGRGRTPAAGTPTGTTGGTATSASAAPGPDEQARARSAAATTAVLGQLDRLPAGRWDVAAAELKEQCTGQLAALRAPPGPAGAGPAPSPGRSSVGRVVTALRVAATADLGVLDDVSAGTAALLARVAASRAAMADVLSRAAGRAAPGRLPVTAPPSGSPSSSPDGSPVSGLQVLQQRLAGEHAAVWGYGVVSARVAPARRDEALRRMAEHVRDRDALQERVVALGATPVAALPAYDVGRVGGAATAGALATRIEDGVAALAAWALGQGPAGLRADAAASLVAAVRSASGWRPGLAPFNG